MAKASYGIKNIGKVGLYQFKYKNKQYNLFEYYRGSSQKITHIIKRVLVDIETSEEVEI